MQILVDQTPYVTGGPPTQTVKQLANEICRSDGHEIGRLIVALSCDGQPVSEEQLAEVLESPLTRFARLEVETVSVAQQVQATLAQAIEVLGDAHRMSAEAADCLNQGRHEPAMAAIQRLLEAIKQVQQTTILSAQLLRTNVDALSAGGYSFIDAISLIKDRLTQLKGGMENQDFVLVSDILRYELGEALDAWGAVVQSLHDQSMAASGTGTHQTPNTAPNSVTQP